MVKKRLEPLPGEEKTGKKGIDSMGEQRTDIREKAKVRMEKRQSEKRLNAAEALSQAVSELSSMTQQSSVSINEIVSAFNQIEKGVEEISEASINNAGSLEQLSKNSQIILDSSRISLDRTNQAEIIVKEYLGRVHSLIAGINASSEAAQLSSDTLGDIEKQADELFNKVDEIIKVSDTINLYALNSAIEASRAGESGAGFSIVADEIRNLTESTEENSIQISSALEKLKADISVSAKDFAESLTQKKNDEKYADEIIAVLKESEQGIVELVTNGNSVMDVTVNQQKYLEELSISGDQVASAVIQAKTAIEQVTVSIEQQNRGIEAIVKTSEDLYAKTNELKTGKYSSLLAEELATSAEELSATIEESQASIQQISSSTDEFARTSSQQASTAAEIKERAAELLLLIRDSYQKSNQSQKNIENLLNVYQKVFESSKEIISRIENSGDASAITTKKLNDTLSSLENLNVYLSKLANYNTIMHILSVSGKIEAAKAGEAGRKFASVSNDIRNLVENLYEHIFQITEGVNNLRKIIMKIIEEAEKSDLSIKNEIKDSTRAMDKLVDVQTIMSELKEKTEDIYNKFGEAVKAIEVINESSERISQANDESSAAIQQVTSSVKEQAQSMSSIADAAEEIAEQADLL